MGKYEEGKTRQDLLEELAEFGVNPAIFQAISSEGIRDLIERMREISGSRPASGMGGPRNNATPTLSETDREILKVLLGSTGKISSLQLSKRLGIPLSTIQRRRKKLESDFLEMSYSLRVEKFGWRRVSLFISAQNGRTAEIARELLSWKDCTILASRTMGKNNVDVAAECLVSGNDALLRLIEKVKSIGVQDVSWSETVEVVGHNQGHLVRMMEDLAKDRQVQVG